MDDLRQNELLPIVRSVSRAFVVLAIAASLVGCSGGERRSAGTTTTTRAAAAPAWAAEGARLRADKAANATKYGYTPENAADFAYQSASIDIVEAGDYVLTFGPVADWFNPPTNPTAISMNTPPDARFTATIIGNPVVEQRPAGRFVKLTIQVSENARYRGFNVWIY